MLPSGRTETIAPTLRWILAAGPRWQHQLILLTSHAGDAAVAFVPVCVFNGWAPRVAGAGQMAVVGANIFSGGWFALRIDDDFERTANGQFYPDVVSLLDAWGDASPFLFGMPIGLPDAERPTRRVDQAARQMLKPLRSSSVFPVPSRATIEAFRAGEAKSYHALSDLNHRELGKRLSRQSAALVPMIAELDELMLGTPAARRKIREAHRELCFWGLNDRFPMRDAKISPEGIAERLRVLGAYLPWAPAFCVDAQRESRLQVPVVVVVDTLATALTAVPTHPSLSALRSIPTEPQQDARGLPMEMVYRLPRSPDDAPEV